jgi:hypothetical protein
MGIRGRRKYWRFCKKDIHDNILNIYFNTTLSQPIIYSKTNDEIIYSTDDNEISEEIINDISPLGESIEKNTVGQDINSIENKSEIIELLTSIKQSSDQILYKIDEIQKEISDLKIRVQKIEEKKMFNFFR